MKKLLLSVFAIASLSFANAQNDTIISHMAGTPTAYGAQGGGYLAGHNSYGDLEKTMKFAAGTGTISSVLFWAAHVEGNPSSTIDVMIYDDNAGEPGSVLGTTSITYGSIDTTQAGIGVIGGAMAYNATANFSSPISLPTGAYYVSVGYTYAAGDTIGLVSSTDGDFAASITDTWEKWSDGSWHSFGDPNNWGLDIALAIFPVVTPGPVSVENIELDVTTYAFENELFVNSTENLNNAQVNIVNTMGQTVESFNANGTTNRFNLSNLSSGIYLVNISSEGSTKTSKITIK